MAKGGSFELEIDKVDSETKKEAIKFIKERIRRCGSFSLFSLNGKITNVDIYGYKKLMVKGE